MASVALSDQGLVRPAEPDPMEASKFRREFILLSLTFGCNHATVTAPIIFASTVLTNAAGQGGNAVLYGSTLICSVFFSTSLNALLGPKQGLALSMFSYATFVLCFAIASSHCVKRNESGACVEDDGVQLPLFVLGSVIGGLGAGLLWTAQGAFYSAVCEKVAAAEQKETPAITAELSSTFAFIFLFWECLIRAMTTILTKYAHMSFSSTFYIMAALAFLSALAYTILSSNLTGKPQKGSLCAKALVVVNLWRDPKIWVLQATNITFGFAAAWLGGYVGREILSKALSSNFIGFAGAILSGLAAILSKVFGYLAAKVGKGPIVGLGAVAFLFLGILSKWVGTPSEWQYGAIIFYVLMGIGRAVYESTNKAIFADFFPGEKSAGAFANVFVFGTAASTAAFIMGATKTTDAELYLLVLFAVLTLPGFGLATWLKHSERNAAVREVSSSP